MGEQLSPGLHGADTLNPGDWIDCGHVTVSVDMIDAFAALTGDYFEIHMSEEAANAHGFDKRVAHGLLVLSLVDGLKNKADAQLSARASMGWDWTFRAPVLAGDTIHVRLIINQINTARAEDQAKASLEFIVVNQYAKLVQAGTNRLLMYR